jgi:MFS transporter, UMF1 family
MRARVVAWCFYDWAYSAFNTVITSFAFATYFVRAVAASPASGTAQWAAAQAVAGLIIAALAAPLGAVADRGGRRHAMLVLFTFVMAGCTASLCSSVRCPRTHCAPLFWSQVQLLLLK